MGALAHLGIRRDSGGEALTGVPETTRGGSFSD